MEAKKAILISCAVLAFMALLSVLIAHQRPLKCSTGLKVLHRGIFLSHYEAICVEERENRSASSLILKMELEEDLFKLSEALLNNVELKVSWKNSLLRRKKVARTIFRLLNSIEFATKNSQITNRIRD